MPPQISGRPGAICQATGGGRGRTGPSDVSERTAALQSRPPTQKRAGPTGDNLGGFGGRDQNSRDGASRSSGTSAPARRAGTPHWTTAARIAVRRATAFLQPFKLRRFPSSGFMDRKISLPYSAPAMMLPPRRLVALLTIAHAGSPEGEIPASPVIKK